MSRQELADVVNAYLFNKTKRKNSVDANYIGKLERGEHRWPNADYREALRVVLQVTADAELGFYRTRNTPVDPDEPLQTPQLAAPVLPSTHGELMAGTAATAIADEAELTDHHGQATVLGNTLGASGPTRLPRQTGSPDTDIGSPVRGDQMRLVTAGGELSAALIDIVHGARECLIAVGSRSREPIYLREIEQTVHDRPNVVHYRILIGPPHGQIFKDHLLRLLELRGAATAQPEGRKTLYISILDDLTVDHERFFIASEHAAVVLLPSGNSPANFDTGLVVHDPPYVQGLVQHGKALYGRRRLETVEAINELVVLR